MVRTRCPIEEVIVKPQGPLHLKKLWIQSDGKASISISAFKKKKKFLVFGMRKKTLLGGVTSSSREPIEVSRREEEKPKSKAAKHIRVTARTLEESMRKKAVGKEETGSAPQIAREVQRGQRIISEENSHEEAER